MMKQAVCASMFLLMAGCAEVDSQGNLIDDEESQSASDAVSSVAEGDYVFKPAHTGKCLDVSSSSMADGAKVQQWSCNGTSAQTFHVAAVGGGFYKITNTHSGRALDVKDVSYNAGATLQQWGYGGGANQQFQFYSDGAGRFVIAARHTGLVLDVANSSGADGAAILQWPSNGGPNQRWALEPVGGGNGGNGGTGNPATGDTDQACTPTIEFHNLDAGGNGALFNQQIQDPTSFAQGITRKVCSVLYHSKGEVRSIPKVKLFIENMDGVAYTVGDETHVSSQYLRNFANSGGNLKQEIYGVVTHEFTHIYQYNDGPGWLIEGMADYTRYQAGLIPISNRHKGGNYDGAYQTTGFFVAWLDQRYSGFGYALNQSLKSNDGKGWSTGVFQSLTGKSVETLWAEYQSSI
jgi:Peptidase of plants and bacteria/Ricin-type beta-trefoil lectin domain-like